MFCGVCERSDCGSYSNRASEGSRKTCGVCDGDGSWGAVQERVAAKRSRSGVRTRCTRAGATRMCRSGAESGVRACSAGGRGAGLEVPVVWLTRAMMAAETLGVWLPVPKKSATSGYTIRLRKSAARARVQVRHACNVRQTVGRVTPGVCARAVRRGGSGVRLLSAAAARRVARMLGEHATGEGARPRTGEAAEPQYKIDADED
eukprot:2727947-Prymnesium_polylepis.1